MNSTRCASLVVLSIVLAGCAHLPPANPPQSRLLDHDWMIQTSSVLTASGREISSPKFDTTGWVPTSVPSTVLAALVKNRVVPDPFEGRNLETIDKARFAVPWWYRTEFNLDAAPPDGRLVFEGINYSANVWVNGTKVASTDGIHGAFRVFEIDVTRMLRRGPNVVAVEIFPPKPGDPAIGFVDWNPPSPDRYMGLWREVSLRMTGGVSLDDVWVRGDVDPKDLTVGRVSVEAQLANRTGHRVTTTVRGRIGPDNGIAFEKQFTLAAHEKRQVTFAPDEYKQLAIASPRLWWPVNMGEPNLYSLDLDVVRDGASAPSDHYGSQFGIRHIDEYINDQGWRGYRINGKPVLLRGGGWADDLLLREDPQKLEDEIRLVRHMNLNMIRMEGFWGSTKRIFDLADRNGVMVLAGWSCLWEWENYFGKPVDKNFGGIMSTEDMDLVVASLNDQVARIRNHPSVVIWNLGSDMLPNPVLERRSRELLAKIDGTRPALGACSKRTSEVSGPTAVKMEGPYEWVPPNYWFDKSAPGGAFGFNTETGPGAQPPVAGSIRRMLPQADWWPIDDMWSYHCARGKFSTLDHYRAALDARYGPPKDLDDFALKAQMANYEAMRGMFESFSLRRPVATGIDQWMLNGAWPKMFWQLYDYYLVPTGAYYAVRNSGRPLHVAFDEGTRDVVAVNDTNAPLVGTLRVRAFDTLSKVLLDESKPVNVAAGDRQAVMTLPESFGSGMFFLDMRIAGADGTQLASNFYWLPPAPDVLDWGKGDWFVTPVKEFGDMKAVNDLPKAEITVDHQFVPTEKGTAVEVTLRNPGPNLAFFIELQVAAEKSGQLAAPVFWDDNYVSLLPGETRTIRGTIPAHALNGEAPVLQWQGMNAVAAPAGSPAGGNR